MADSDASPNRVLLGQLISNGDCLYATAVAQQIKHDFPGCHLTWAISSLCRRTIEENLWVDAIWEIPLVDWSHEHLRASWNSFASEAVKRYEQGLYDFVFFTQIYPGNPHHFEGTVRPGIFLGYPGKITVPLRPSLVLRTEEVEKVNHFAQQHRLQDFEQVVLFECSSKSGQSHITPEFALQTAERIVQKSGGKHAFILCSQRIVSSPTAGIIDASALTLREMAELTKHCTLLIGCSSGISCISTSTWAKPLPMIQILTNRCEMFASLAHDYLYFGLPTSHVIEIFDADVERIVSCFDSLLEHGWEKTRRLYHEDPQIAFSHYLHFAQTILLNAYDYYGFCVSLRHVVDRYGWHPDLEAALRQLAQKILQQPSVDREISPDRLLRQLTCPARALSSAAVAIWGNDLPSLRPETCALSLRRSKIELEQILGATYGFSTDAPACSQLIAALTDKTPKDRTASLLGAHPKEKWSRLPWILALMQQAEYSEARQELIQWKQIAPSWNSQLEEILGDLNWMQGCHSIALANYHDAVQKRGNDSGLQKKIERLLIRNGAPLAITKPKAQLRELGLVLYAAGPINNISAEAVAQVRLQIADLFSLDTVFMTTLGEDLKAWSLVSGKDLQNAGFASSFNSNRSPDCKEFIGAAVDWADRTGKSWIALARTGSIITVPFLRQLQDRLVHNPSALIVDSWDILVSSDATTLNIRKKHRFTPALILMRIDWWKKNSWRFRGYRLRGIDWMALYAVKILRRATAAYLGDAEQRLLNVQSEAPAVSRIECLKQMVTILKGDLGAVTRLKLFELYCRNTNLDLSHDQTQTETLINHFFRSNILKVILTRLRRDETSPQDRNRSPGQA